MGFNPANYFRAPKRTIPIGNSAHPVLAHVRANVLRLIPSSSKMFEDLYFIEINDGKGIITYRDDEVPTLQYHALTLDELKEKVRNEQPLESPYEVVNADPKNKHLGNDIMRVLDDEGVI